MIDGGTARGTTAVADGDGFLTNDGGTMRMTKVETLATYIGTKVGGGLVFLATADASSDAAISFTQLDNSEYDSYVITVSGITSTTANAFIYIQTSANGGSSYDAGSNNYRYESHSRYSNSAVYNTANTFIIISEEVDNNAADTGLTGAIEIYDAGASTRPTTIMGGLTFGGAATPRKFDFNGIRHSNAVTTAIQFKASGGTLQRGTFTLYGRVNA